MKFVENYYKVLIEFHRSSPDVTQNVGAKRKAQPTNLHAMKKHSAESLVKHMKWKKQNRQLVPLNEDF